MKGPDAEYCDIFACSVFSSGLDVMSNLDRYKKDLDALLARGNNLHAAIQHECFPQKTKAAIDEAVPVPVLTASLYERFSSRGEADYADKLLSAMRFEFGGHLEKPAEKSAVA